MGMFISSLLSNVNVNTDKSPMYKLQEMNWGWRSRSRVLLMVGMLALISTTARASGASGWENEKWVGIKPATGLTWDTSAGVPLDLALERSLTGKEGVIYKDFGKMQGHQVYGVDIYELRNGVSYYVNSYRFDQRRLEPLNFKFADLKPSEKYE